MRKLCFIGCLVFCFALSSQAQRAYYPGKLFQQSGDTTSVLISIADWGVSPNTIKYKTGENSIVLTLGPDEIKGFSVEGKGVYLSATVDVDLSSNKTSRLSMDSEPNWKKETLFLHVLLEGSVNLYKYRSIDIERYFYGTHDNPDGITQLVYKRYTGAGNKIFSNRSYRKQLQDSFDCGIDREALKKVDYNTKDMMDFFAAYSECKGETSTVMPTHRVSGEVGVFAGAGLASISGNFGRGEGAAAHSDYTTSGIRADLSVAYIIRTANPLSFFVNVGFETFSTDGIWPDLNFFNTTRTARVFRDQPFTLEATYATIGLGARKTLFFNKQSGISFSLMFVPGIAFVQSSSAEILPLEGVINSPETFELEENSHTAFGLAYHYKQFFLEARYFTERDQLTSDRDWTSSYQSLNVSLGMRLK